MPRILITIIAFFAFAISAPAGDGNRLTYLDELNPYYPNRTFPKLITPQWVGEDGVDAVVILAIDDMRGHEKWEQFLRPILNRLKDRRSRPRQHHDLSIDPRPTPANLAEGGVSLRSTRSTILARYCRRATSRKPNRRPTVASISERVPGNKPVAFRCRAA